MSFHLRLRYLLAKHGPVLAAGLLVVGTVLLGVAGVAYASPPTTEVTDHTERQTVSSSLTTAATVTGNTSLYEKGETLREQPVYLLDAAPEAELSLVTALSNGVSRSVDHRIELVYTARRGGETFWQQSEPLAVETSTAGEETASTATLSMPEVREQRSAYQSEFGQAASVSVSLRTSTVYTVGQYEGELTGNYPISFGDRSYSIQTGETSNTHSTPVTSTRTLPVENYLPFVLPLAGGIGFLLAGAVTGVAVWRSTSDADDELADALHHTRYAEWISTGRLPGSTTASTVQMESLEELVDVAIDSRKRVIYDPARGAYAVLDSGVQYQYTPE